MIITGKKRSSEVMERVKGCRTSLPIFCTASHWNTEAILLAAKRTGEKYGIKNIPVAIAMTFNYPYMPQAQRVTFSNDARIGFLSNMAHLQTLAGDKGSPYYGVAVLPHLDHGDPVTDLWALTHGTNYLASVMFDAQRYPPGENIALTSDYVSAFGEKVFIEGIMDELTVFDAHAKTEGAVVDNYPERAFDYIGKTGVDFLVADLGTEQQSQGTGKSVYLKERAKGITHLLNDKKLVLHGTSCLTEEQISTLPDDGILRVNMWTRIAREAGLYAYGQLRERDTLVQNNDFNAIESHRYLMDSIEKAAAVMELIMDSLGYKNLV